MGFGNPSVSDKVLGYKDVKLFGGNSRSIRRPGAS